MPHEIKLSNSPIKAIIDDEDFYRVDQFQWRLNSNGHVIRRGATIPVCLMHRFIMNEPVGKEVHHANGIKHDNRKMNLVCLTKQEHLATQPTKSASGFRGVYYHKQTGKWRAMISINRKMKNLGLFNNEIDAARAYESARKEVYK